MPAAHADSELQPPGSAVIPAGPAPAWIVADMDTGQVLAGRDVDVRHPPASTIKVLLALVALDEISLDSTIVANQADTQVECNCVGIKPGRSYTARELLDAVLLASGNDAANTLADMVGGFDAAVGKMNAKAAALGAPDWVRRGTVRFSFGRLTGRQEVDALLAMLPNAVASVRDAVPK